MSMVESDQNVAQMASPASMAAPETHGAVRELVAKHVADGSTVLDLAAGEGAFSIMLKNLGHDVLAVDASSDHWKVPEIEHRILDLDSEFAVEFNGKLFDAIAAIEIIEHLENPFRFVRECAKLLRPGGLLFLTTPNVEAIHSRLIFLYTGRLNAFGAYETVRPAHITPIFRWKLDMILKEAKFSEVEERYTGQVFADGTNLKVRLAAKIANLLEPLVKGSKGGAGRIVVAKFDG